MSSAPLSGIDVSYYQGNIDWQSVKSAGVEFAFARATYGTTKIDPAFHTNWQVMRNAAIIRGAYHFFVAAEDPVRQANFFANAVGSLSSGDLPPVLDVEAGSGTNSSLVTDVQTWLTTVEQRLGLTPMIYTAPSYWNEYMNGNFGKYPLWVAEYGVTTPRSVKGWSGWTFWQHSQSGHVSGIEGTVDLDYFNGSYEDLLAFVQASPGTTASEITASANTASATTASATTAPASDEQLSSPDAGSGDNKTYTVRPGDALSSIAQRYGVTVDEICLANGIENPNLIEVGQVLIIP
jgi:lysozyme